MHVNVCWLNYKYYSLPYSSIKLICMLQQIIIILHLLYFHMISSIFVNHPKSTFFHFVDLFQHQIPHQTCNHPWYDDALYLKIVSLSFKLHGAKYFRVLNASHVLKRGQLTNFTMNHSWNAHLRIRLSMLIKLLMHKIDPPFWLKQGIFFSSSNQWIPIILLKVKLESSFWTCNSAKPQFKLETHQEHNSSDFHITHHEIFPVSTVNTTLKTTPDPGTRDRLKPGSWPRYSYYPCHCPPAQHRALWSAGCPPPGSTPEGPPPGSTSGGPPPACRPRSSTRLSCWARWLGWALCSLSCFSFWSGTCSGKSSTRWTRRRARWRSSGERTPGFLLVYLEDDVFVRRIGAFTHDSKTSSKPR